MGALYNYQGSKYFVLCHMEETLESCVVWSPMTSSGKWTGRSYVGETQAVLGKEPGKVQNNLLVNKTHPQSRKTQGIYPVYSSDLVCQICFQYCLCKMEISLGFGQRWSLKDQVNRFQEKKMFLHLQRRRYLDKNAKMTELLSQEGNTPKTKSEVFTWRCKPQTKKHFKFQGIEFWNLFL